MTTPSIAPLNAWGKAATYSPQMDFHRPGMEWVNDFNSHRTSHPWVSSRLVISHPTMLLRKATDQCTRRIARNAEAKMRGGSEQRKQSFHPGSMGSRGTSSSVKLPAKYAPMEQDKPSCSMALGIIASSDERSNRSSSLQVRRPKEITRDNSGPNAIPCAFTAGPWGYPG